MRVHTAYLPWKERVPRGRRYLHMRVLPTFVLDTGASIGAVAAIVLLSASAQGIAVTPDLLLLAVWIGLAGGLYLTLNELWARPDRVIW